DQGWSVPAPRPRRGQPDGQRRRRADDAGGGRRGRWEEEPGDVDAWAAHHRDDHSEELRLGQRRAAMRASDTGAEMQVEDRWATVRRQWRPEADDQRWVG